MAEQEKLKHEIVSSRAQLAGDSLQTAAEITSFLGGDLLDLGYCPVTYELLHKIGESLYEARWHLAQLQNAVTDVVSAQKPEPTDTEIALARLINTIEGLPDRSKAEGIMGNAGMKVSMLKSGLEEAATAMRVFSKMARQLVRNDYFAGLVKKQITNVEVAETRLMGIAVLLTGDAEIIRRHGWLSEDHANGPAESGLEIDRSTLDVSVPPAVT